MSEATAEGTGPRYYEEYSGYANTIRAWFVAYGIGGPAILMTQEHLYDKVLTSGNAHGIALVFFLGVAIQVLASLLYKAATWHLHYTRDIHPRAPSSWAKWVERSYWMDVTADLLTLALFACSTAQVLRILANG